MNWDWTSDQVIWHILGAEATEQGNCTAFKGGQLPHCCRKSPTIVDLFPGSPYNLQTANCCKGGVLSSMSQDSNNYVAVFEMTVGGSKDNNDFVMPQNFTLGVPGYSCGQPFEVPPSKFFSDKKRRHMTQALHTWNVTCIYSPIQASTRPKCCVSLSAFYNSTIVPCPQCSCNCPGLGGATCVKSGDRPPVLEQKHDPTEEQPPPILMCSRHMCPIRVHWHIKQSYKEYWRVKMTVTNLNFMQNNSQWNLVVLHPNLQNVTQVFSYNYKPLNPYGYINDTGMFWGIQHYNDMLLQAGDAGNVQSEMLLRKDPNMFTFREGWGFPRRILFNGDECVMPSPDEYPRLPNDGFIVTPSLVGVLFSILSAMFLVSSNI
ncbi:hypothetical protein ACFE04_022265 [Oxalis oulophora]